MQANSVLLKILGIFLILEAIVSIGYSQDQQKISQAGRLARIGVGIVLLTIKIN